MLFGLLLYDWKHVGPCMHPSLLNTICPWLPYLSSVLLRKLGKKEKRNIYKLLATEVEDILIIRTIFMVLIMIEVKFVVILCYKKIRQRKYNERILFYSTSAC